jgi:hypothetical protein
MKKLSSHRSFQLVTEAFDPTKQESKARKKKIRAGIVSPRMIFLFT